MQEAVFLFSEENLNKGQSSGGRSGGATKYKQSSRRVVPTTNCELSDGTAEIRVVEKVLKNGDLYNGGLSAGVPHGTGKYLWSDGCMYEGEWTRGKASGKGRFSWPSGATYEGQFKDGRMDGEGTFIGIDGDTYRGHWLWGRKHGYGEKRYANGDVYQGNWKANLQDGSGRYVWCDGNEYVGEWKNGVISGKGIMTWANGNRYEGLWENGAPVGKGVLSWNEEKTSNNNQFGGWGRKSKKKDDEIVQQQKLSSVETLSKNTNFPRICISELEDSNTCDNVEAGSMLSPYTSESDTGDNEYEWARSPLLLESGGAMSSQQSPRWLDEGDVKKPGYTVTAGHKSYDLMLNLQLGIRYSVGKHASVLRELRHCDFDPKDKQWTRFPPEGSKCTPPHQSIDFKWKDYCPIVFRHLRELFTIDPADYMLAICGDESLREFSSPGKSGSSFYLTQDERFMIKTMKKSEIKVLLKMLPNYYEHVSKYKNSLVTKFFGVHCVKPVGGQKTRFIVMGNLFCSEYRIHKRFDLKGSSHGRTIDKDEGEIDETTTLKDLDLKYVFRLETSWFHAFINQIDIDCEFLEAERIMDYSLLIGLHFRESCLRDDISLGIGRRDQEDKLMRGYNSLPNMDSVTQTCTPAKAEQVSRFEEEAWEDDNIDNSNPKSTRKEVVEVILYFGIIDILQDYDITKKLEHAYKSLHADPTSISAVDPKLYSKRRIKKKMGKGWLACVSVSCLSSGKDKKQQRPEKEKKKWSGRQKSRESIEFSEERTSPIDPSSSSITRPSPYPPPLPDFAPQPLLPPPSPPPPPPPLLHPLPTSASNEEYGGSKEAKTRQALALASAVAAEAAVVAAHAAAEVVRLTNTTSTNQVRESKEEAAAIKIQNAYRCYKASRTLRMLRGMARLKTLLQGKYVKRQMNAMLSSMQTLTRLQAQIQERRNRLSEENKARQRLVQQKGHQKEQHKSQSLIIAGDFDSTNRSKEQIKAKFVNRKEASVRRERALAYAYSHQQTWRSSSKLPHQTLMDANTPDWGWSWLERWMASRPWDPQSNDGQASFKNSLKPETSIKTSPARSKASQKAIQLPTNNDSRGMKSEGTSHMHNVGGGSSTNVKDGESVGSSSSSRRSSFGNAEAGNPKASSGETTSNPQPLKKSKAGVETTKNMVNAQAMKPKASAGTTFNLASTQALKSKVNVGSTSNLGLQKKKVVSDKNKPPQVVLPKKRLSSSTSLGSGTKVPDSDKATTGAANGEKKRRNGGSR
ncbi:hypothetical protein IGI04_038106 [Brassica rapa subsp. trilocularis]|uniref:1-phosphatidylinositol-4-phosphate 5-kinase n=1 Tax=Brassica rapa subsp. trilocularis TaxID=1813537 RepID=A0ABQ7LLL7_BRACM|nr:hypothetical protein IGI04_038106 [Brassica rapa subsp. trilocularis]